MGFLKAYIWNAPPKVTQEFVFYGHPDPYIPPNHLSLKKFYRGMLNQAIDKEYIHNFVSIEFMKPLRLLKVQDIPYFDGDFWYTEIAKFWQIYIEGKSKKKPPFSTQLLKDIKEALRNPVNKELITIVNLHSPEDFEDILQSPINDSTPLIDCKILFDREKFFEFQMNNNYSFETLEEAHYSTKILCSKILNDFKLI
uniref:histone acetyltransferase n=1 Tax=Panagrolaimus superbus TaxID=310955 RepID=A0A914Z2W7_9BILA